MTFFFLFPQSPQASSSVLHNTFSPEGSTGVKRVHYVDKARDLNRPSTEPQPHGRPSSPTLSPTGPSWTQQHPRSATAGVGRSKTLRRPRLLQFTSSLLLLLIWLWLFFFLGGGRDRAANSPVVNSAGGGGGSGCQTQFLRNKRPWPNF